MRYPFEPAPWLAASNTPSVSGAVGLGLGGAAGVQTDDSSGFGRIRIIPGPGYTAAGNVALTFPAAPPALFIAGDEGFGVITQAAVGRVVTISWTTALLVPRHEYAISYEWSSNK